MGFQPMASIGEAPVSFLTGQALQALVNFDPFLDAKTLKYASIAAIGASVFGHRSSVP